jgi:hypothetical protein
MHVEKIWFETPGAIACSEAPELGDEGKAENFTSLLNPSLINLDAGGRQIFGKYLGLMNNILETQVDSWTMTAAKSSLEQGVLSTRTQLTCFKKNWLLILLSKTQI